MEEACTDPNKCEELFLNEEAMDMEKKPWKGRLCRKLMVEASNDGDLGDERELEGVWINL